MALHLLKQTLSDVESLGTALISMRNEVIYCRECRNISDQEVCAICANPRRDHGLVCVVEDIRDVMAIENTSQFNGVYHVLGGIISPVEGIGPRDLHIDHLVGRVAEGSIREVILALPTTIEGDTTSFYLFRKLQGFELQLTTLARGVSIGDELEHTDEVTLGRSIVQRMPYKG